MAQKFKVGDKVKIVGNEGHEFKLGRVGTVKDIFGGANWPYRVLLRNNSTTVGFSARELQLVQRNKTKKST